MKSRSPSFVILVILVFISGAVVMSLEFSVSRFLIPVFGSSIFVWGGLIGVILTGLSLGYHIGGKLADKKHADFLKFCSIMFSAGLYIVFIPIISPVVISYTSTAIDTLQYASLIATLALVLIPTFLLGIVSPYSIKLATNTLSRVGNISGNLYSAATIGSIVGTFLIVFVLIPSLDIRYILYGLGLSLMVPASFVFSFFRKPEELGVEKRIITIFPKIILGCIVVMVILSNMFLVINPIPAYSGTLLYQKETPYSHLEVVDSNSGDKRALMLSSFIHSVMDKNNPTDLVLEYTKYFPIGFIFNPDAKNVLFVGGGGFSGPRHFLQKYPTVNVHVVEIDPVVIDVAKKYFNINTKGLNGNDQRLDIYNDDARNFLSSTTESYDIIVLDAYARDYIPFHLSTLEYFQVVSKKLTQNGVVVSTIVGSLDEKEETSKLYRAAYKTLSQVFPRVYAFPIESRDSNDIQGIILVATKNPNTKYFDEDELRQRQETQHQQLLSLSNSSSPELSDSTEYADYAEHIYDVSRIKTNDVPLLTDKFAPVENLLDPITSVLYNTESGKSEVNKKVDVYSSEGILILFIFPASIIGAWILYIQQIWGRSNNRLSY